MWPSRFSWEHCTRDSSRFKPSLQLSPPGKNEWGRNQADNDRDHTVDHDERLKITDTAAGVYDVKFVDKSGRTCIVPNVQVKAGAIFTIEEKELKGCAK